ncbi:MAG: SO2930 family diheme c-type cytochrome [Chitinophagales bacterium]|nr:SO2930 family diheme c-type cytochrome [Chitinophagales bacterium]
MVRKLIVGIFIFVMGLVACNQSADKVVEEVATEAVETLVDLGLGPLKLSEYNFFKGNMADLVPADDVVPYDLATPLFSDYSHKARFVRLPKGVKAKFDGKEVMDFPVGTVLIKNFYYPHDFRDASKGRRIMETRLLVHKDSGWVALPYIWNDEQTEAILEVTGGRKNLSWIHSDGSKKEMEYVVPNMNQCKGCHARGEVMTPIGPTARQLNWDYQYVDKKENQLQHWQSLGILDGYTGQAPKAVVWNNPATGSLDERARMYLDINCAHCHRSDGPANTSGLLLSIHESNQGKLGFHKSPVAAGRGSGGLLVDIDPGHPEKSILLYRMNSSDPGVMMPELGRQLIHTEGVDLVREWINSLK